MLGGVFFSPEFGHCLIQLVNLWIYMILGFTMTNNHSSGTFLWVLSGKYICLWFFRFSLNTKLNTKFRGPCCRVDQQIQCSLKFKLKKTTLYLTNHWLLISEDWAVNKLTIRSAFNFYFVYPKSEYIDITTYLKKVDISFLSTIRTVIFPESATIDANIN